jgi:predicted nucleic acid-binding protein
MTTLIDTNIVIALMNTQDPHHTNVLAKANELRALGPLIVSDMVYCESSVALPRQVDMDEAVTRLGLDRVGPSDNALFIAGKAFQLYRDVNKGPKPGVLPDFLIGATAEAMGLPLLTTNPKDFVAYFPKVTIIRPDPIAPAAALVVIEPANSA